MLQGSLVSSTKDMKIRSQADISRREMIANAVLVLAIAGILLGYNLSQWPVTWYDEGVTLQVSRNLAESGRYGILSSDGFRAHSPTITTGPTVSGPIALIFAATSAGLLQARIVMVGYALLSVLCLYLLALRLFDMRTAVIGSLLLISVGAASLEQSASFLGLGRMAMGEVPALALLLAGTLLWSVSLASDRLIQLIGAGLLWGLAVVTKTQSFFIVAGLLLTWAVYTLARRKPKARSFGVPLVTVLACAGSWLIFAYFGGGATPQAAVTGRVGTQLAVLQPGLVVKSIRVLLLTREIVWGLPALVYGLYVALSSRRPAQALPVLFLSSTCLIWLSWFVLGSVGWGRYAFTPIAIMSLFTAKLLVDLLGQLRLPFALARPDVGAEPAQGAGVRSVAVLMAVALMVAGPLQAVGRDIVMTRDDSPATFTRYLDEFLPAGTAIECFEPEIVFLSRGGLRFHQPPFPIESLAIRHTQLGVPYPDNGYSFREQEATYVVAGPFSKRTEVYDRDLQSGAASLVKSVGAYDLYEIRQIGGNN
jgi:4-amino-4-deoxy-L-arabinose transferase-like glycosyltransferase